jgi:4-amino-4-deoxy-L-arabinose transferase-like glycosyltransferase
MSKLSNIRVQLLIVVGALLLFVPGLGAVHLFDRDEMNFAETAREMCVSGDWSRPQIGFLPFNEEPPLFMWMQAACMTLFGVGESTARLPNALCGAFTLVLLYRIGSRHHDRTFGAMWVLAYVGSLLPHLYFHSGLIDPWFNLFIFLGLHAFLRSLRERSARLTALSGLLIGLAVLTKGPAALIIVSITAITYAISVRSVRFFRLSYLFLFVAILLITVGLWFGVDYLRHGPAFTKAFIDRQVALFTEEDVGHGGFFGYHFVVLLIGCFPASLFALQELLKPTVGTPEQRDIRRWMLILFWTVLLLFSVVNTKIVHYSSLCYFPLTYLAALQLQRIWKKRERFGWTRFALGVLGNVLALVLIALPFIGMHLSEIKPMLHLDAFTAANLDASVQCTGWEASAGVILFSALLTAHFLHQRNQYRTSLLVSFGGVVAFVWASLFFFVNKVEAYSQRTVVDFCTSKASERCWLMTRNFKSYALPFYGRVTEAKPDEWVLLTGTIDRPVYAMCKIDATEAMREFGAFKEFDRRNGFVFYKRDP